MTRRPSRFQLLLGALGYIAMCVVSIGYLVLHHYGVMP